MLKLPYSWKTLVCLNHSHLIIKKRTAFGMLANTWFSGQLSNWKKTAGRSKTKQRSNGKTETVSSRKIQISRGIPQGSVLGPAQLLFTNDFSSYKQD